MHKRLAVLCDVMHRLSPAAWKVVSLIARDEFLLRGEQASAANMLDRDLFGATGIDMSQPAAEEMRSGPKLVEEPDLHWTRLSLAQICGGIKDRGKRRVEHRGTGLAKSTAVEAINEAVKSGILKKRKHKHPEHGDLPTGYAINWKRVTELVEESRRWSNVKTTSKFGRPQR